VALELSKGNFPIPMGITAWNEQYANLKLPTASLANQFGQIQIRNLIMSIDTPEAGSQFFSTHVITSCHSWN
jgi:hypothetical protein